MIDLGDLIEQGEIDVNGLDWRDLSHKEERLVVEDRLKAARKLGLVDRRGCPAPCRNPRELAR